VTAVRMLPRKEFKELLRPFGCTMIADCEILDSGIYGWSYWRTSWGFFFSVPEVGPDLMCAADRFSEILNEIRRSQP